MRFVGDDSPRKIAFFQLGDCTDARVLVDTIATKHKESPFAAKAQTLLQEINKQKSRCTS